MGRQTADILFLVLFLLVESYRQICVSCRNVHQTALNASVFGQLVAEYFQDKRSVIFFREVLSD